jgi:hypothetical protein
MTIRGELGEEIRATVKEGSSMISGQHRMEPG